MTPRKFIAHQVRALGRPLHQGELEAIQAARDNCHTGKRDTVKAMWLAFHAVTPKANT